MSKKKSNAEAEPQTSAAVIDTPSATPLDYDKWKTVESGLHLIPIELVVESADNARKRFDEQELQDLATSMAADGINLEAAIVHRIDGLGQAEASSDALDLGRVPLFELNAGHRRFRALQLNGAKFIKAEIVKHVSDDSRQRAALVSNLHRADLNAVEKSDALIKMLPGYKNADALARSVGLQVRTVQDLLNLNRLIPAARTALQEDRIYVSHAVLICREDEKDQLRCLDACFRPEAVDNGAGMEMVPKLVSEKQLRDWIKDNLRTPAAPEQPKLFGTEAEQKEAAKNEQLERQADGLLAGGQASNAAGDGDRGDGPDASAEAGDTPSNTAAEPAESDISDDDLTPEQQKQVQPEGSGEYQKVESIRVGMLRRVCEQLHSNEKLKIEALRQIVARDVMKLSPSKFKLFEQVRSQDENARTPLKVRNSIIQDDLDSLCPLALLQDVITLSFLDELNPNVSIGGLDPAWLQTSDTQKEKKAAKPAKKVKSKSPSHSEVAKVMKAEKKKLEKKSAKKGKKSKR